MKKIVLVRCGAHSRRSGRLTDRGNRQVVKLAEKLRPAIQKPALILASPLSRAIDAASALATALHLTFKDKEHARRALQTCDGRLLDPAAIVDLIRDQADRCETLILVGHMELVQDFPGWLASLLFDQPGCMKGEKNLHAQYALVVDCDSETTQIV